MPEASVGTYLDQTTNVHGDLSPEIAFYPVVPLDDFADFTDLGIGEIPHSGSGINPSQLHDALAADRADSVNV